MKVIHFTEGATDPIDDFDARGVRYVPLACGESDSDATVSCFHLAPGSRIAETPCFHDSVLLVVHGRLTLWDGCECPTRIDMSPGIGVVLGAGEPVRLESDEQAIVVIVESPRLKATARGISTPQRVWGQYWPGEYPPRRRTIISAILSWFSTD